MDTIHKSLFLLVIFSLFLVALNYVGDYNTKDTFKHTHPTLSESQSNVIDFRDDKTLLLSKDYTDTSMEVTTSTIGEIIDTFEDEIQTLKEEILKNRAEIRLAPRGFDSNIPDDVTVPSQTPFLTLSIEKTEWLAGSTIIFTGTAIPDEVVIINMYMTGGCGQQDICSMWVKVDSNSNFKIEFETFFDDPIGTWKAYVKQGSLRSETIEFEVTK